MYHYDLRNDLCVRNFIPGNPSILEYIEWVWDLDDKNYWLLPDAGDDFNVSRL